VLNHWTSGTATEMGLLFADGFRSVWVDGSSSMGAFIASALLLFSLTLPNILKSQSLSMQTSLLRTGSSYTIRTASRRRHVPQYVTIYIRLTRLFLRYAMMALDCLLAVQPNEPLVKLNCFFKPGTIAVCVLLPKKSHVAPKQKLLSTKLKLSAQYAFWKRAGLIPD
jgi:hypothetical protein